MNLKKTVKEIQDLQRMRSIILKSKQMQENRIQAIVAGIIGYASTMKEADRVRKFKEASAVIEQVLAGQKELALKPVIDATYVGIGEFQRLENELCTRLEEAAKTLPVAKWVEHKDRKGFAWLFLAQIIGECGDLSNYSNPAKVWKRMGLAPIQQGENNWMGSTWRRRKAKPVLSAEEWTEAGYSPRRRSIAYLIGKNIMMQNKGPYRARFEQARKKFKKLHKDASDMHTMLHGMLCATKMLLKDLWSEWNKVV